MDEDDLETQDQRDLWRALKDPTYLDRLEFMRMFEEYKVNVTKKDRQQAKDEIAEFIKTMDEYLK